MSRMIYPPVGIVLHHFGSNHTFDQVKDYHTKVLRWVDIGYHFVVHKNGKIIPGRSLNLQSCNGDRYINTHYLGVACQGNFQKERMPAKQKESLFLLLKAMELIFPIRWAGVVGHNEIKKTLCPGRFFPMKACKNLFL